MLLPWLVGDRGSAKAASARLQYLEELADSISRSESVLRVVFESKPVNQAGLHLGQLLR